MIRSSIEKIIEGVQRLQNGDLSTRIFLEKRDILFPLAEAFNTAIEHLMEDVDKLYQERQEMESVLFAVHEAFLVIDNNSKVLICNEGFKKISRKKNIEGQSFWQILPEPDLIHLVQDLIEQRKSVVQEIKIDEETYLCKAAFIPKQEKAVLLLHNITEIKRLEQIKKELVVNVSHELKTPLTSIQGYVETLLEECQDEPICNFLTVIQKNTERLIHIVQDMLLLSEIEERKALPVFKIVDLVSLVRQVTNIYQNRFKKKHIQLDLDIYSKPCFIQADPFWIEQVLINLIDNAWKYTEKGRVVISLAQQESFVVLQVRDTGIGIPAEHQDRIFERFYVVDKARSRQAGGTGLGLSIVKHTVKRHGGKISLISQIGRGTTVKVVLPLCSE